MLELERKRERNSERKARNSGRGERVRELGKKIERERNSKIVIKMN